LKSYILAKILYKMRISSFKKCEIDKTSRVDAQCVLAYVKMGRYSYVGGESHITNAVIGNFVSIGGGCQIGGGSHPIYMVSTSPVFLEGRNIMRKNFAHINYNDVRIVEIGNDVWIGDGCYIKSGVKIGDGAVIGAHAVVTHDVDSYSIVAGCPAREIKKRFSDDIIRKLHNISWWNWCDSDLKKYACFFDSPENLIHAVGENK